MAADQQPPVVPDVVGFDASDACAMVHAAGLTAYGPDLTPAPTTGVIIAQEPVPDTPASTADPVQVWTVQDHDADAAFSPAPASLAAPGSS